MYLRSAVLPIKAGVKMEMKTKEHLSSKGLKPVMNHRAVISKSAENAVIEDCQNTRIYLISDSS